MIHQMIGPFSSVDGIPRGGLRLAEALVPFAGLRMGPTCLSMTFTQAGAA